MDRRLAKMFEPPTDDPDLVGRALKDAKKDISWLLAEVDRLQAALDEECRWSVGWKDLAHRAERDRDRLRDGITRHRDAASVDWHVDEDFDEALWALLGDDAAS